MGGRYFVLLLVGMLLVCMASSFACITPVDEYTDINSSVTICPGTYYINDTDDNGIFTFSSFSNNAILDCNGSSFIGDDYGLFAYVTNTKNVTIMNCNIQHYSAGITVAGNNVSIVDNNLSNIWQGIEGRSGYADILIANNIIDVSFLSPAYVDFSQINDQSTRGIIRDNLVFGSGGIDYGMLCVVAGISAAGSNKLIVNNTVRLLNCGLYVSGRNNSAMNNTVTNSYTGLFLYMRNGTVSGNMMMNNTQDVDFMSGFQNSCPLVLDNVITSGELVYVNSTATITGKNGTIILCGANNSIITGNLANIIVAASDNITITNNTAHSDKYGIRASLSTKSVIANNTVSNNAYGIYLYPWTSNYTVQNNLFYNNSLFGIDIVDSPDMLLADNVVNGSKYGIATTILYDNAGGWSTTSGGRNVTLNNNTIDNSSYAGLYIYATAPTISGNAIGHSNQGVYLEGSLAQVRGNTFHDNNRSLYLASGSSSNIANNSFSTSAYGAYINSCSACAFSNNSFSENTYGLYLRGVSYSDFTNNLLSNNTYGVYSTNTFSACTFTNNTISGNGQDILFIPPSLSYCANSFQNNTVTNGELTYSNVTTNITGRNGTVILCGANNSILSRNNANMLIFLSSNVTISGNTISNQMYGLYLSGNNSVVVNNTITNNSLYGLYTTNNLALLYNNFFNNTNNAYAEASYVHSWNTTLSNNSNNTNILNGSIIGGNFWANPTGTGCSELLNDTNYDTLADAGVCVIAGANNTDFLPLTLKTRPVEEPTPELATETTTHSSGGPSGIPSGSLMPDSTTPETTAPTLLSTTSDNKFVVTTWSPVRFSINIAGGSSQQHAIRATRVDKDGAQFIIQSEPVTVYLKINETKNVDLDNDTNDDIALTLAGVKGTSAVITVKPLAQEKMIPHDIDAKTASGSLLNQTVAETNAAAGAVAVPVEPSNDLKTTTVLDSAQDTAVWERTSANGAVIISLLVLVTIICCVVLFVRTRKSA